MKRGLLWVLLAGVTVLVTTVANAQPSADDFVLWRSWHPIEAAISVAPLDGPEELKEKAEIIADRQDALTRERVRLAPQCLEIGKALRGALQQLEAVRGLASVRRSRDVLLRQRQQALRSRRRELENTKLHCEAALAQLTDAIAQHAARHAEYIAHAQRLLVEETPNP